MSILHLMYTLKSSNYAWIAVSSVRKLVTDKGELSLSKHRIYCNIARCDNGTVGTMYFDLDYKNYIEILDEESLQPKASWIHPIIFSPIFTFSPDGTRQALILVDTNLTSYSIIVNTNKAKRKQISKMEAHSSWINSMNWNKQSTKMITCDNKRVCKLWDMSKYELVKELSFKGFVAKFSPVDDTIVAFQENEKDLVVGNIETGEIIVSFDTEIYVAWFEWSPYAHYIATLDTTLCIWDATTGCEIKNTDQHFWQCTWINNEELVALHSGKEASYTNITFSE